jgi:ABC-type multidrug transport system fused ATPase/permease subunit
MIDNEILKSCENNNLLCRANNLGLSYRFVLILIALSLIVTITEVFGIGMFLPIFQFIRLDGDISALILESSIWKYLINVFTFFQVQVSFAYLLLIAFTFFLLRQVFMYVSLIYNSVVKQRITQSIRNEIFNRYLGSDTSYHDNTSVGNIVNVITTEVNMAVSGLMVPLELIVLIIMILSYLVLLSLLSWQMTLLSMFVILISSIIPKIWIDKSAVAGRKIVKANLLMSEFLVGRLHSPRLVRLSGTEIAEKKEFKRLTGLQRKHSIYVAILGAKTGVIMEPIVISLSLVFLYVSYAVIGLKIEVIGIYLVVVMRMLPISKSILSKWQRIQRLLGSIEIIEDHLYLMNKCIEHDRGVDTACKLNNSIIFNNVSYSYQGNKYHALKDIEIIFEASKMMAIVGPSGGGKSTLIDLIPRLRTPIKGFISFDGVNIEKFTLKSLRSIISYVSQSPQIFNGTIREHILYGKLDATEDEIQESIRLSGVDLFINKMPEKIDTFIGENVIKLSGGQIQRLDIARALVRKSKILILDEPTSSLDAESEKLFNQVLSRIRKETDTTIILVSHRLAGVSDADCIFVLNKGRVEASGSHSELMTQGGWYAKAWNMQKNV